MISVKAVAPPPPQHYSVLSHPVPNHTLNQARSIAIAIASTINKLPQNMKITHKSLTLSGTLNLSL